MYIDNVTPNLIGVSPVNPNDPVIMFDNPGIVPPWLMLDYIGIYPPIPSDAVEGVKALAYLPPDDWPPRLHQ